MVVGVHDAQHSQAVSPLWVSRGSVRSPSATAHETPTRPSPRATTTWRARSTRERDYHGDYSDGLLERPVVSVLRTG